jgi:pimeloyl-ACP methyl ester carboxylesterase
MLSQLVGNGLPDDLVEDVMGAIDAQSLRAMRRWQRHEFRHDGLRTDYRSELGELDVPTLLIHGEHDPLLPLSWSVEAAERLPDGELLRLPGVGHWPPRERPARVLEAIGSFANGQ